MATDPNRWLTKFAGNSQPEFPALGDVAQLGERWLCKPEVTGSIPVVSTPEALFATTADKAFLLLGLGEAMTNAVSAVLMRHTISN